VIVRIEKPENMPVDSRGHRADIIMDAGSTISRMNVGRLYEHYIGASARDTSENIRSLLEIQQGVKVTPEEIYSIKGSNRELFDKTFSYLLGFFEIVSPLQADFLKELNEQNCIEYLSDVINDGIYIYYPPDNEPETVEMVKLLEQHYRPTYGPVRFVGNSGIMSVTKDPVRIGPVYMLLLEKIADSWSAVNSANLQHFGVLSPINKSEKYRYPYKNSPVKAIGETEGRILAAYCRKGTIPEIMDRNNNPNCHKFVVKSILKADVPTKIEQCVDRSKLDFGSAKPLQIVKHIASCAGFEIVYEKENFND